METPKNKFSITFFLNNFSAKEKMLAAASNRVSFNTILQLFQEIGQIKFQRQYDDHQKSIFTLYQKISIS